MKRTLKIVLFACMALALLWTMAMAIGATDTFESHTYTYNSTTYSTDRPNATVTTHTYYVGGDNGSNKNDGLTEETPLATIAKAVSLAKTAGYLNEVLYSSSTLTETKIVLIGDTTETSACERINGGILTIEPKDGVNVTVHMSCYGAFLFVRAENKNSSERYAEVNIGAPSGNTGSIFFDLFSYNPGGEWGGVLRLGDTDTYCSDIWVARILNHVTMANLGYDVGSHTITATRSGRLLLCDIGTMYIYDLTITQNSMGSSALIACNGRGGGAGIFIYKASITKNMAQAVSTTNKNAKNGSNNIVVYDAYIADNYAGGWGNVDCSDSNSTMIFYGGTIKGNDGKDKGKQICANGKFYISEAVTIDNSACQALDGTSYQLSGTYECNNHWTMKTAVIYAKDGSAVAYGYSSNSKSLKDQTVGATLEDYYFEVGEYAYSQPNTTSCKYIVNESAPSIAIDSSMAECNVYYLGATKTHQYAITEFVDSTSSQAGYKRYTCSDCQATYDEVVPISDCDHSYQQTVVPVSCTESGYTEYRCSKCNYSYQMNVQSALGHDYITVIVDTTCLAPGYKDVTCSRCDYHTHVDYDQLAHNYQLESTYPVNYYRCQNGCNDSYEKIFVSYYKDSWNICSEKRTKQTGDSTYTAEVSAGTVITVGKKTDGTTDVSHQTDTSDRTFIGWYTLDGQVFTNGETITVDRNIMFYEIYGYSVGDETTFADKIGYCRTLILTEDITLSKTYDPSRGNGQWTIIYMNGHTLSSSANTMFAGDRAGLIIIGEGTVLHTPSSNAYDRSVFATKQHGYGDSDVNNPIHRMWVGKGVTVTTTGSLFRLYGGIGTDNSPSIKIAGTVNARTIFQLANMTIALGTMDIYETAKITVSDASLVHDITVTSKLITNIYGGTITMGDGASAMTNWGLGYNGFKFYLKGGTYNFEPNSALIKTGYELEDNGNNTYTVVKSCTAYGDGHHYEFVDYKVTTTCTTDGIKNMACACGATTEEEESAFTHNFVTYNVVTPADCIHKGSESATCTRCPEVDVREIPATGVHSFTVNVPAQSATCTQIGWDAYTTCSVCEEKNGYVEKPMLPHSYTGTVTIAYANGLDQAGTKTTQCANCVATDETEVVAIITVEGYSTCEIVQNGQIIAGYSINQTALAEYNQTFTFGVLVGFADETVATNFASVIAGNENEKVFGIEVDTSYSRVNITIEGITASEVDIPIVISAFTKKDDVIAYYQNSTGTLIDGTIFRKITYNSLAD